MIAGKLIVVSLLTGASVLLLGGCPSDTCAERLRNQPGPDCGTLIGAGSKILANHLEQLTPDEIQILSDTAIEASGVPVAPLTDAEAQAVVNVIASNNITTVQSLQALILLAQTNPSVVNISAQDLAVLMQIATVNLNPS